MSRKKGYFIIYSGHVSNPEIFGYKYIVIQNFLKTDIQLKPEGVFLLTLMDVQLKRIHRNFNWYMTDAAKSLYAQKWKYSVIPMTEEWML